MKRKQVIKKVNADLCKDQLIIHSIEFTGGAIIDGNTSVYDREALITDYEIMEQVIHYISNNSFNN